MTRPTCPLPPGSLVWSYLRVSGDEQADRGVPIAGQRQRAQEYADQHQLIMARWFIDEAKSGGSTAHRDAFNEMIDLSRAKPPPVHGILIWDLKRFARNLQDSQFYKADLRRRGYTLIFLSDDIPETDFAPVYEAILEWKAEKDRADIGKDCQRGIQLLARMGYAGGGVPPVGYQAERLTIEIEGRERQVRRWVPDPVWWPIILRAWQMRADGASLSQIIDATGLVTTQTRLSCLFRNRTYLGIRHCRDIEVPGAHEAMVTQEVFDRVQALRIERGKSRKGKPWTENHPRRANSRYLLSGLLYCGLCGAPMSGSCVPERWDKTGHHAEWRFYVCSRRKSTHMSACSLGTVKAARIEEAVMDALVTDILVVDRMEKLLRDANAQLAGRDSALIDQRTVVQKGLREVDETIARLVDAIERQDSHSLRKRLAQREHERLRLESQLADLDQRLSQAQITVSRAAMEQLITNLSEVLRANDVAATRGILRALILRIEVMKDKGILHYSFPFSAFGMDIVHFGQHDQRNT